MKKLHPSFVDAPNYRGITQNTYRLSVKDSDALRKAILERDKYTCAYCNFHAEEWQTIYYLDGDSGNNKKSNLATVCPMCHLILNTQIGCRAESIVELYQTSNYTQNQIIQMTRKMRSEGKPDIQIIRALGLRVKMPFKMNKEYLEGLFGFVTSWKGSRGQFEQALAYGYGP